MYFPPGNYIVQAGQIAATIPGVYFMGSGLGNAVLTVKAGTAGDTISITNTGSYLSGIGEIGGGVIDGLTIDGTNAGAGSCGIHAGDIESLQFDCWVLNFNNSGGSGITQGIGVKLDNRHYWTERSEGTIRAYDNWCGVYFGQSNPSGYNSFARTNLTLFITSPSTYSDSSSQMGAEACGVIIADGAVVYDATLQIVGNFGGQSRAPVSPATYGAVLYIMDTSNGSGSRMTNSALNIGVESGSDPYVPYSIYLDASNNSISNTIGFWDFGPEATEFKACNNSNNLTGHIGPLRNITVAT